MTSFATELSARLTGKPTFWEYFNRLSSTGVAETLPRNILASTKQTSADELAKLLYCAGVFCQTEDERYRGLAQTIALNSLLLASSDSARDRSLRVLTDLGNFPGLKFAEEQFGLGDVPLLGLVHRRISEALNTVRFGKQELALTDYQKRVWDVLPTKKALAVSAPTSAGKSFLIIEYLCRKAERGLPFSAVYVAPTRALLSEVHDRIQLRLAGSTGVRVSTVPSLDPAGAPSQVFVVTQERLHVLLSIADFAFDLVIVDEAQNMSEGARGMILHDCLETVLQRNPHAQVVLLAPGAEGLPEVARTVGVAELEAAFSSTSPVLQNRVVVTKVKGYDRLKLELLGQDGVRLPVATLDSSRGLAHTQTRLAAVSLELGGSDGSLVYARGAADAEKIATQLMAGLPAADDTDLKELSDFIRDHIHPEYRLATMVRHRVAFHYGRMPTLLREALETSFKSRELGLDFLVCTTTLFQGVNLPARNVFINTPTRGNKKAKLDPALLWNFAGRAGRLSKDVVGNVFLVDYDEWDSKPMDTPVPFQVTSAIAEVLESSVDEVLDALNGDMPVLLPWLDDPPKIRACAGLLIAKAARGEVRDFITRVTARSESVPVDLLAAVAERAAHQVNLPQHILDANWTIDPFGLRRLYDRIVFKIEVGEVDDLIPLNPHEVKPDHYARIFRRILREVFGNKSNFGGLVASLAVPWMRGVPYPVILANWIAYKRRAKEKRSGVEAKADSQALEGSPAKTRRRSSPESVDGHIREAFNLIEDVVRFQFVQLGKAYLDLLRLGLENAGLGQKASTAFDFSLALELGVATRSGTSFVELGLSRIAATAMEGLFPDSNLDASAAREALRQLNVRGTNLSGVIVAELRKLRLIEEEVAADG